MEEKRGDKVTAGKCIAEIETDKATMEWESTEDGTLTEIYVEWGGKVDVGVKIAFIAGEGEAAPNRKRKRKGAQGRERKRSPKEQAETEKPAPAKKQNPKQRPKESKKSTETKRLLPNHRRNLLRHRALQAATKRE